MTVDLPSLWRADRYRAIVGRSSDENMHSLRGTVSNRNAKVSNRQTFGANTLAKICQAKAVLAKSDKII